MTDVPWARAAAELLRADVTAFGNRLRMAPGSLALGAFVPFSLALVLLFPFSIVVNNMWGQARPLVVAYAMPLAILWAFGPPRWAPAAAVLLPSMPVSHRAVYFHSIARIMLSFSFGFAYAMLPLLLLSLPVSLDAGINLVLGMWPSAAVVALSLTIGTALWGILGGARAGAHWLVRGGIVLWFSSVAFAGASGASAQAQLAMMGPLRPIAEVAAPVLVDVFFFPFRNETQFLAGVLLLAMCVPALILPVRHFAPRAVAEGSALRQGEGGPGAVRQRVARPDFGVRRVFRPFPVPEGRRQALSYLARQWLKVFLWIVILYAIFVAVSNLAALLTRPQPPEVGPWRPPPPDPIDPAFVAAGIYTLLLAGIAVLRSPEAFEWAAGLRGRRSKAFALPVPAALRIGPPATAFKRWPVLQTMPFSRADMERAFLVPLALLLVAVVTLTVFWLGALNRYQPGWTEPSLFVAGVFLVITGGVLVGTRDNKRFAAVPDTALDSAHSVGATLWAAGVVPLLLVGFVWFVTRGMPGIWAPAGRDVGLALFASAAIVMPLRAYASAKRRLVTTQRPYDSPASPLLLAAGSVFFFFMPVALLVVWWLPNV